MVRPQAVDTLPCLQLLLLVESSQEMKQYRAAMSMQDHPWFAYASVTPVQDEGGAERLQPDCQRGQECFCAQNQEAKGFLAESSTADGFSLCDSPFAPSPLMVENPLRRLTCSAQDSSLSIRKPCAQAHLQHTSVLCARSRTPQALLSVQSRQRVGKHRGKEQSRVQKGTGSNSSSAAVVPPPTYVCPKARAWLERGQATESMAGRRRLLFKMTSLRLYPSLLAHAHSLMPGGQTKAAQMDCNAKGFIWCLM